MAINQENMQNGENGNGMASAQMGNRMIGSMQGVFNQIQAKATATTGTGS